jgi:uncharacterized SAM-binding protein YcdF (DUF218 family)
VIRSLLRALFAAAVALTAALLALWFILPAAGRWLVVSDPLQSARCIVVFGGHVPFRAMEAAAIYKQGWAAEVWLTQGADQADDIALKELGIDRLQEHLLSRQVLVKLGVPDNAIRILPGRNENTADEVQTIASYLKKTGGAAPRVVLITSKSHTRRVRVLWHRLVGSSPEAIVRYAQDDPFQPDRWWRSTQSSEFVAHEWFGLLNAWAGFPLASAGE